MPKIFAETKTFFPEFKPYLKHDSAESCINHMIKEDKKGKVLAKFLELAANNIGWKKDSLAQKLVKKAVEVVKANSSLKKAVQKLKECKGKLKLKDKNEPDRKKLSKEAQKKSSKKVENKPVKPKEKPSKKSRGFLFDTSAYKTMKASVVNDYTTTTLPVLVASHVAVGSNLSSAFNHSLITSIKQLGMRLATLRANIYLKNNGKACFDDEGGYKIFKSQVSDEFSKEIYPIVKNQLYHWGSGTPNLDSELDTLKAKLQYNL